MEVLGDVLLELTIVSMALLVVLVWLVKSCEIFTD